MTSEQRACANDIGLPAGARERLDNFANDTATTLPASILEDQGTGSTFSTDFLAYCHQTGLSLDWVWFGTGDRTWSEERA